MIRATLSLVCTLLCFVFLIVFVPATRKIQRKGTRMVEEARQAGRVAQGVLVSSKQYVAKAVMGEDRRRMDSWGVIYEYQVNGQTYRFRGNLHIPLGTPPDTIPLYYEDAAPQDAAPEEYGRYAQDDVSFHVLWLLPFAIFFFFYFLIFR